MSYNPVICMVPFFRTLQKATISSVMSVCLSLHPHETTRLTLDGFSLNITFEYFFRKPVEKNQFSLNIDKNDGNVAQSPTNIYDNISLISSKNVKYFRQNL